MIWSVSKHLPKFSGSQRSQLTKKFETWSVYRWEAKPRPDAVIEGNIPRKPWNHGHVTEGPNVWPGHAV